MGGQEKRKCGRKLGFRSVFTICFTEVSFEYIAQLQPLYEVVEDYSK
jgi:hypothetical protein